MKNPYLIFSLIIIFFFTSCKNKKDEVKDILTIYVDNSVKSKVAYDISKDVNPDFDIVALETKEDCLIGTVDKMIFENDKYYILSKLTNSVLTFSSTGKHISTLNKQGQGPDEYVQINNFAIEGENIWICDKHSYKILCFDKEHNVVDRISLKESRFWVEEIEYSNGYLYLINNWIGNNKINYNIGIYDIKEKKLALEKPYSPLDPYTLFRHPLRQAIKNKERLLVTFSYNDTLFSINNKEIAPQYRFIFSERMINTPMRIEEETDDSQYIYGINKIDETNNNVILTYGDDKSYYFAIYNKEKESCEVFYRIINKSLGGMNMLGMDFQNQNIFSIRSNIPALREYFNENIVNKPFDREEDKVRMKEVISQLNDESNPVIFRFKLKQDSEL